MMKTKIDQFISWLDGQAADCENRKKKLLEDDRIDESVFEKIKINVYDIFRTILLAGEKTSNGDAQKLKEFFLLKLEQIPAHWIASYNKAKQNDDIEKMQIESLKLDTVQAIRAKFLQNWEEKA